MTERMLTPELENQIAQLVRRLVAEYMAHTPPRVEGLPVAGLSQEAFLQFLNTRFEAVLREMDKRFEVMNQRFEVMDKRFEALMREMDKRFEARRPASRDPRAGNGPAL